MRDFLKNRGVDITDDEYREMKVNIRTLFELLDRWDSEQKVTNLPEFSKIGSSKHGETACKGKGDNGKSST